MTKLICISLSVLALVGCSHDDPAPVSKLSDPSVLIDTYQREVKKNCSGNVVTDSIVRTPAFSTMKINPDQNIYIASVSFFNLDNGDELTPRNVVIRGPGGDNLKFASFCQAPKPDSSCLVVHDGNNRINYKYWSQENPDVMGEDKVRSMHFTVSSVTSPQTCTRVPAACPDASGGTSYSDCKY